jgi:hypothetical protein
MAKPAPHLSSYGLASTKMVSLVASNSHKRSGFCVNLPRFPLNTISTQAPSQVSWSHGFTPLPSRFCTNGSLFIIVERQGLMMHHVLLSTVILNVIYTKITCVPLAKWREPTVERGDSCVVHTFVTCAPSGVSGGWCLVRQLSLHHHPCGPRNTYSFGCCGQCITR